MREKREKTNAKRGRCILEGQRLRERERERARDNEKERARER